MYVSLCVYVCKFACVCVYVFCIYTNAAKATGGGVIHYSFLDIRQLSVLEAAFANDCYLNESRLMQLIQQTGLGRKKILCWFNDRRRSVRHGKKEGTVPISEYF